MGHSQDMTLNGQSSLAFQHLAPELRLYCGNESLAALSRELRRAGSRRAVVVCGRSLGEAPVLEHLRASLGPLLVGECTAAQAGSPLHSVEQVANELARYQADAVIAVGGGSAAVTARAASILLVEQRPLHELCTFRDEHGALQSPRLTARKPPQFAIPTTPSTAFVKAGSAVHDLANGQRLALFDPGTRARAVFLHPDFLSTSPVKLVQNAALNALCTAIEALESPRCDPISEAMLKHAVQLSVLHMSTGRLRDLTSRTDLAIAAVLCGRGTDQSGGGLASALGHAIGHRFHLDNGVVNSIVLPHTMRYNASEASTGLARIAQAFGRNTSVAVASPANLDYVIDSLNALLAEIEAPRRLRDAGVGRADLHSIAEVVMSDWFIGRNSRSLSSADDVMTVLEAAW
jgi:alcohol dehydrogenase